MQPGGAVNQRFKHIFKCRLRLFHFATTETYFEISYLEHASRYIRID